MKLKHQATAMLEILRKEFVISNMSDLNVRLEKLGTIDLAPFCSIKNESRKDSIVCTTTVPQYHPSI